MSELTQAELKAALCYDPKTGIFHWLSSHGKRKKGSVAGTLRKDGYIRIQIKGCRRYAQHLAYLYMTGKNATDELDHVDRNRSNNAWENLRPANKSQNCANRSTHPGAVNFRGVSKCGSRFKAQIRSSGVTKYLGLFDTAEEAHVEYLKAANQAFGEFAYVVTANDNQKQGKAA